MAKTATQYSKERYEREKKDPVLYAQLQERRKRARAKAKERDPHYHAKYRGQKIERMMELYHKNRHARPWINACGRAKVRAKARGIDFDIDSEYVKSIWTDVCPILGIPLNVADGKANDNSPSIDRIDSSKGYVKGNCVIISQKANVIKNSGTLEEHRAIVSFLESQRTLQEISS